jgi:hypothetical protein
MSVVSNKSVVFKAKRDMMRFLFLKANIFIDGCRFQFKIDSLVVIGGMSCLPTSQPSDVAVE